jgi:ketosteroid isomerase-like protein
MKLRVKNIIGGETEEWAVIEMEAVEGTKCKNGMVYDQKYSWSTRWRNGMIVEVRAYLDGGLLDRALVGNGLAVGTSSTA